MLNPHFQTMSTLVGKIQELAKQNPEFESQLSILSQKNDLLENDAFKKNAQEGLGHLKQHLSFFVN
jgi:hypothetical protein